jgi:hypothetical protein
MSRTLIKSGISYGKGFSLYDLREAAKSDPVGFMRKADTLINDGKLTLSDMLADSKSFFRAFSDIQVPITIADELSDTGQRAITTSAMPVLTGTAVVKMINDRYAEIPTIGQELVQEIDDNKKVTTMAAILNEDKNVDEVRETEQFPEIGASEETIEIRHRKNGRKLTLTTEMIRENDAPNFIMKVNALADIASDHVEELTLKRVTDYYGSKAAPSEPYVYRPEGTGTQLYNATANNPGTRAPLGTRVNSNAFADETNLDAARAVLAAMLNSRGKRISIPYSERILLVPDALVGAVSKVLNSEYVPGVENEVSNWGPRGRWFIPPERLLSSPKLDDLSTSAWYYGAFKRQFIRKWKLRFTYVTLGQNTQAYLDRDIAFQARISWDCEVGATDYVNVVQSIAATTAPADE